MRTREDAGRWGAVDERAFHVLGGLLDDAVVEHARVCAREARMFERLGELMVEGLRDVADHGQAAEIRVRSLRAELAAALSTTETRAERMLSLGHALVRAYQATLRCWAQAAITRAHVEAVVDECGQLAEPRRATAERTLLQVAQRGTPADVRAAGRELRANEAAAELAERHRRARQLRHVRLTPEDDGMATLSVLLPATDAVAAYQRTRAIARRIQTGTTNTTSTAGARRNLAQTHADVVRDLLVDGHQPTDMPPHDPVRAHVSITVPALGLLAREMGQPTSPASPTSPAAPDDKQPLPTLDGYGPIDWDTALRLAAVAPVWRRILTDPATGKPIHHNPGVYQPSPSLARLVRARDGTCRFPGCRRPAAACDIDHTIDWQWDGPTQPDNLACLCRSHHVLKHASDWTVRRIPGTDAVLAWTSPTGSTHTTHPATPAFSPD